MKTLSDNLDVVVQTAGIAEGYATAKIYANGIGVFVGQTYIQGDGTPVTVNINDIATLNHGKNDYIKLDDNGYVTTVPLESDSWGTYSIERRWNRGQIGNYKVTLTGMTPGQYPTPITYDNSIYALAGYDYVNKNLKPLFINDDISTNDTSLGRIMQGCDWIYNHEQEIGDFLNLLLPHYPLVKTDKYGFGLQIYVGNVTSGELPTPYSLRRDIGSEVELGSPIYGLSNTTFLTLKDLINGINDSNYNDSDVSIYLKMSGTSGDEFGDWEEGYTEYKGHVLASEIRVLGQKNGVITDLGVYEYGATYKVYMRRYIYSNPDCDWDWNQINSGNLVVFTTDWGSTYYVNNAMLNYEDDNNTRVEIPKSAPSELEYDHLYAEPIFSTTTDSREIPDIYHGTCPVAILDGCYARYYLAWNDRYGDIMSQPFDGKVEYSEDVENNEIKDYKERRRISHKSIQPKWTLNTKWLPEDIYPMYEAIFTSPYVLLYDTQTDRAWNVIVTNSDYKEKTHKTEKTLFNLELKVEANKTENYIF